MEIWSACKSVRLPLNSHMFILQQFGEKIQLDTLRVNQIYNIWFLQLKIKKAEYDI